MKQAFVEIYISLSEPQQFSSSQSSEIKTPQGRAKHGIAGGRGSSNRKLGARLQKGLPLVSAEYARDKPLARNPQRPPVWHNGTGVFELQKAAELTDERQSMRSCRFSLGASASNVVLHDGQRDQRIFRRQTSSEKTIQLAQRTALLPVAITHGTLLSEELTKLRGQWREELGVGLGGNGAHRVTSSSAMATVRNPLISTRMYPYVVKVDWCPRTSAIDLSGCPAAKSRVASVWRNKYRPRRPFRSAKPTRRKASRMMEAKLFSTANGSKGAQCRRKMMRLFEAGRPSRRYSLSASAMSGRSGRTSCLPVLTCCRSIRASRQWM